jgi:polysaccharide export outer membrane protein
MHKKHLKFCFFTLLFFLVFFPSPAAKASDAFLAPPQSSPKEYLLGLGDIIEVQVWKEPDLTKTLTVRLDGRISLPLAGDILAAGKSPEQLASDLEEKLKAYITEPSVTVILSKSTSRKYFIIGQINQPGEFTIDAPITILQALARSGGFQEWAKKDKIVIIRRQSGKENFLPFDYEAFTEGKNISQNIDIAPGDTIIVP